MTAIAIPSTLTTKPLRRQRIQDRRATLRRDNFIFFAILAASLFLRLIVLFQVTLIPEEAYYWMYSQHPSLSYFDHPPMVAWVIGLGTAVCGDTELGVRLIGHLLMVASSGLIFLLGRLWFSSTVGLIAAASLHVIPIYFFTGILATMDAPLIFFWLLTMLGVTLALRRQRAEGWYIAGLALGGAMLSKYTGVFVAVGTLLAVVGHRPWRRQLLTPHPYLASILALAVFSPVLIWNSQHEWASFRFQMMDRFSDQGLQPMSVLEFLGMQLAVITPWAFFALGGIAVLAAAQRRRLLAPRTWFAVCCSVPLLAVMTYKSLKYSIHFNWTLPAYLSVLPLLAHHSLALWRRRGAASDARWPLDLKWTGLACMCVNIIAGLFLIALQPRLQLVSAFGPWKQIAAVVEEYEEKLEHETGREPLIIADGKYRLASVVAFYRTPLEAAEPEAEQESPVSQCVSSQWMIHGPGLGFEYWMDPKDWIGCDCVYVDDDPREIEYLRKQFDTVEYVTDPRIPELGNLKIALCYGYRGPKLIASRP